jgi:hypothetical protein
VVGIVVAKLDALAIASAIGDVPQNAISPSKHPWLLDFWMPRA